MSSTANRFIAVIEDHVHRVRLVRAQEEYEVCALLRHVQALVIVHQVKDASRELVYYKEIRSFAVIKGLVPREKSAKTRPVPWRCVTIIAIVRPPVIVCRGCHVLRGVVSLDSNLSSAVMKVSALLESDVSLLLEDHRVSVVSDRVHTDMCKRLITHSTIVSLEVKD